MTTKESSGLQELLCDFQRAHQRLSEAVGEEVDAVILPSGAPHLMDRAQRKVQKENALLSSVLDSLPAHLSLLDRNGTIVSVNRAWKKFAIDNGYEGANHGVGRNYLEICENSGRHDIAAGIRAVLQGEKQLFECDYPMQTPTDLLFFRLTVTPTSQGAVVSHLNTTEDRRAQDALRASEERFRLVSRATHDAIWDWDIAGDRLYWNENIQAVFGYSWTELDSWNNEERLDKVHPEDRERVRKGTIQALKSDQGGWSDHYRFQRKDGSYAYVSARGTILRDSEGRAIRAVGCLTDVTGEKNLQEQLLRAQRLESIGTLSGGIAHDLNNVLAPIIVAVEFLQEEVHEKHSRELIDTIKVSAKRGAALVKQILTFARGSDSTKECLNPSSIVHEIKRLADDTFPRNIAVEVACSPQPWRVMGEANRLHQVLLNMCVNARDAMPQGGTLSISVDNVELEQSKAPGISGGQYVEITVRDTGVGIPRELHSKIFDPFFTTKEPGKGTGLGLSTAFSIIREHGGFITLESDQGEGSAFQIYLPAVLDNKMPAEARSEGGECSGGSGRTILLVDDEASIRRMARRVLERHNYRVIEAANGLEALALYKENSARIALVITDMSMPEMDGATLARALKVQASEVKIVGTSGRPPAETIDPIATCLSDFIPKPYTMAELLQTVSQVISESGELEKNSPDMVR